MRSVLPNWSFVLVVGFLGCTDDSVVRQSSPDPAPVTADNVPSAPVVEIPAPILAMDFDGPGQEDARKVQMRQTSGTTTSIATCRNEKCGTVPGGVRGDAYGFTAASATCLELGSASASTVKLPFTLSLWVKPKSLPTISGDYQAVVGKFSTASNRRSWLLALEAKTESNVLTRRFAMSFFPTGGNQNVTKVRGPVVTAADLGRWHHLAVSVSLQGSAATAKIFLNGLEAGFEPAASATIFSSSEPIRLGCVPTPAATIAYLDADVDELRLFDRALTEEEIKRLMENN